MKNNTRTFNIGDILFECIIICGFVGFLSYQFTKEIDTKEYVQLSNTIQAAKIANVQCDNITTRTKTLFEDDKIASYELFKLATIANRCTNLNESKFESVQDKIETIASKSDFRKLLKTL